MKTGKIITLLGILCLFFTGSAKAQNYYDALRYNIFYPGSDPINLGMAGSTVANKSGFGSVSENPATAGLFDSSSLSFALSSRNVSEDASYLGVTKNWNDSQSNISNVGLVYKMPTIQGSFVVGGGYNQLTDYNRAFKIDANNPNNSITEFFNQSSFYHDIAYNGYALDSTSTGTESILQLAQNGFRGINQYAEVKERGQMGEYTLFAASEFQKNLYLGIALAFPVGDYTYHRSFLERDLNGNYQTYPYNVDNIDSEDRIHDKLSGFYARLGFVYKLMPWLNIGGSYRTKSTLKVKETYYSSVQTTFDDGDNYKGDLNGKINYEIQSPGRLTLGASIIDYSGLSVNGSVEYMDYSKITMSKLGDKSYEITQNNNIESNFKQVWNYRIGASYKLGSIEPRVGYAYNPSPRKYFDASRKFYSAGLGIGMTNHLMLNIGVQLARWNDNVSLYSINNQSMTAGEKVDRINAMIGIRAVF